MNLQLNTDNIDLEVSWIVPLDELWEPLLDMMQPVYKIHKRNHKHRCLHRLALY